MSDGQHRPTSHITGRRQAAGLRLATALAAFAAAIGVLAPDPIGAIAGIVAMAAVIATPLLRVAWLIFRWSQEGDYRYVAIGLGLLSVIAAGAALTVASR
ncbi:MAG TPA: DUF1634 domain-containing protein [Acidimicrobiia bacterium]|nr:DUF1634 domain-containing protein [Acidimicrobiia bacterium]